MLGKHSALELYPQPEDIEKQVMKGITNFCLGTWITFSGGSQLLYSDDI
jgi:hypothetical protein